MVGLQDLPVSPEAPEMPFVWDRVVLALVIGLDGDDRKDGVLV
jgi:hypothetical protein